MGVKSKNHHFKKLLRLLSCQLGASSRHRGTCVVGDAVGDAGVVPNGGASEGAPPSQRQFARLDGLRATAGINQPGEPSPGQTLCCHLPECAPIPKSTSHCQAADQIIILEKKCAVF